jgi:hypothetical protein
MIEKNIMVFDNDGMINRKRLGLDEEYKMPA